MSELSDATQGAMVSTATIRPLTRADVTPAYVAWMQDPEVTRDLVCGNVPQTQETVEAFVRALRWPDAAAFAIDVKGQHVGNVMLRAIDWPHQHAEVGILIGDRGYWRHGLGSEAVRWITEYARRLGLRRVWAGTCGLPAGKLFVTLGWAQEGVQEGHCRINGAWRDHYLFGLML